MARENTNPCFPHSLFSLPAFALKQLSASIVRRREFYLSSGCEFRASLIFRRLYKTHCACQKFTQDLMIIFNNGEAPLRIIHTPWCSFFILLPQKIFVCRLFDPNIYLWSCFELLSFSLACISQLPFSWFCIPNCDAVEWAHFGTQKKSFVLLNLARGTAPLQNRLALPQAMNIIKAAPRSNFHSSAINFDSISSPEIKCDKRRKFHFAIQLIEGRAHVWIEEDFQLLSFRLLLLWWLLCVGQKPLGCFTKGNIYFHSR